MHWETNPIKEVWQKPAVLHIMLDSFVYLSSNLMEDTQSDRGKKKTHLLQWLPSSLECTSSNRECISISFLSSNKDWFVRTKSDYRLENKMDGGQKSKKEVLEKRLYLPMYAHFRQADRQTDRQTVWHNKEMKLFKRDQRDFCKNKLPVQMVSSWDFSLVLLHYFFNEKREVT